MVKGVSSKTRSLFGQTYNFFKRSLSAQIHISPSDLLFMIELFPILKENEPGKTDFYYISLASDIVSGRAPLTTSHGLDYVNQSP